MDLFLDNPQGLPKLAASFSRLSENPDDWQAEVLNELYRQAPYIGDFEPRLIMHELDPEKRYALGVVELSSKKSVNPRDDKTPDELQGVKKVLIPLVVKEGKMFPLDTFLSNGKAQPLSEPRLRREMFRPQLFEAARQGGADQDLMSLLYPPHRSGGLGLGAYSRVGQEKTSALIEVIRPTIKEADIKQLEDVLNADPTLRVAATTNPALAPSLQKLAEPAPQVSGHEMIKRAVQAIPPKVVQISKTGGGFLIKTANPEALNVERNKVDRPTAEQTVGKDIVRQVERDGTVTVSTDSVVRESLVDAKIKIADEFGEYKVKTKDGKELLGWVFPHAIDLDGTSLNLSIFSNGSQCGLQENIAASPVGKGTNLIDETPDGFGCFYLARQGGAVALAPVRIKGRTVDPDGSEGYLVSTMLEQDAKLKKVKGLEKISKISDGVYGIPADCGWLPMRDMTQLAGSADEYVKTAQLAKTPARVQLMYDGGSYSLQGWPIEKLARAQPTEFIDADQAVFNLALLGVQPSYAKEKLAAATKLSVWQDIEGVRPVTLAVEKLAAAKTAAKAMIAKLPAKSLLLKEAAALDDPLSVDKVLAVGFLNPENVGTFVSYLPQFEEVVSKLSQLLFASRMGLSTVDTGALERAVKHLDKVIVGLRELSQTPDA